MDESLLRLGRPAGGLEEIETQCELLAQLFPSSESFTADYMDVWKPQLEIGLNESMSQLIQGYRCGNLMAIEDIVSSGLDVYGEAFNTALLDGKEVLSIMLTVE